MATGKRQIRRFQWHHSSLKTSQKETHSTETRRQPHSNLRPPPRGTPASIFIYLIFPETRVIGLHFCRCMFGSIFIQFCADGSKTRIFSAPECVLAVQGRSGSSEDDDFGTNWKRVYDFLLVRHCDYGPILHRFRDMVTYWLKIAYFC